MSKTQQAQQSITSLERTDRRGELAPRRAPHWKRIDARYFGRFIHSFSL